MVAWSNPQELNEQAQAFNKLLFTLFGLYVWELIMTCGFEFSLITRKRKFTWPLVTFFFLCRYCIFFAVVGLIISVSVKKQALYTFNSWAGNMTILCASTSLMLRTIALWERRVAVVLPLGALSLGHWALLYRDMFIVKAAWDENAGSCVVVSTNHLLLNISFFYTMGFDLVILIFTAIALGSHYKLSGLSTLLFTDGLVYFLVTFSFNTIPAVLNILDLSGKSI
ncbi:hypothetical protein SERLA73DRAFT_120392 [Serpula lacrymans var. lacrymans S7.3]|uniref:Chitin synthase export chaperone n=2 Tax=Serpula lacrymans var. lacrymans TaxID=341189 RepID=F8PNL4_SERL3|nr:uncharacterized protein SERLADRAFT_366923 [Serpula lacrymans var. lacrymans S7.9]EGO01741.1 hypothetical protein SERLA73DRAFT_120392 [Serpula lacrymans var. lacrymans S7.3]EGO27380.1 hypothetical protein SERLADRAFT_366923 [Serpula lacrymans var. lacrymans S7.9]